ncbi:crotonase/enoyl-CoA hydratase family protein [Rhizomicrobium electricum]|uniref:Crotonase/enoyl-CoA hydratase family protein n=1 Tax=Rhizomicrobium electricum TaxID=480070 RepID=A0ABN1EX62_9PROT|nr:crotonase/enoyl-CoA hydratase family protein [Rhizomicrobium electricum]NIJ49943.1 enoyl-CoA hydratase [Rhizomicrobium electricum]
MSRSVYAEKIGAVTTVILDRPEAGNTLDRTAADALAEAFAAFEEDTAARAAVLWGAGGNFSAGLDLAAMSGGRGNRLAFPAKHPDPLTCDAPMGPTRMRLSKPVIAAVAGLATGGGLELALWCDLRIAEEDAVFGADNRRSGLPMMDGGTVRLPRLVGQSHALDIILTGRPVGAREALAMGLVNRVVTPGTSRREAESLAAAMVALPQASLGSDRSSVYEQFDLAFTAAMENEFVHGMKALASGEGRRGAALFAAGAASGQDFGRNAGVPGIK